MENSLFYKGYRTTIRYSADDNVYHGKLEGIDDCVLFEGADLDSAVQDFHAAVDDYLDLCADIGKVPE